MELYTPETRQKFEEALGWLNKWACSRTYGLGTRLPFDEQFLIESLSDSTIYMAYYTICHFLHSDLEGKKPGLLNIPAKLMTPAVFDYIFREKAMPKDSGIPEEKLKKMQDEFKYW